VQSADGRLVRRRRRRRRRPATASVRGSGDATEDKKMSPCRTAQQQPSSCRKRPTRASKQAIQFALFLFLKKWKTQTAHMHHILAVSFMIFEVNAFTNCFDSKVKNIGSTIIQTYLNILV